MSRLPIDEERVWFEGLFREHYDAVLAYALARADADVARDATARTFLVAWRRRRHVPERTRAWLLGVARRSLADEWRTRARQERLAARLVGNTWTVESSLDPAEDVVERAVVLGALAELDLPDREVLQLVAWDRLGPADAADVLGCSPAAFSVRLFRARRRFRAALARHDAAMPYPHPAETAPRRARP